MVAGQGASRGSPLVMELASGRHDVFDGIGKDESRPPSGSISTAESRRRRASTEFQLAWPCLPSHVISDGLNVR
jgi:hypothetical protein